MAAPTVHPGSGSTVEFQVGGVWYNLPGASDASASGGEAPETDIRTYAGTAKTTGQAGVPTVAASVGIYNPLHRSWRLLRENAGHTVAVADQDSRGRRRRRPGGRRRWRLPRRESRRLRTGRRRCRLGRADSKARMRFLRAWRS